MPNHNTANLAGLDHSETPQNPFDRTRAAINHSRAATQRLLDLSLKRTRTPEVEQVIAECLADLKISDALEAAISLQARAQEPGSVSDVEFEHERERINASLSRGIRSWNRARNAPVSTPWSMRPARRSPSLASDGREQIRRQSPGQRRGPPEPDPLLNLLDQLVSNIVALRTQIAATRAQPPEDYWISQSEAPCPTRVFTRETRKRLELGDDRAVVRGRVHYMRRSLLDEFMRGSPQPKRASNKVAPEAHLSPLESLKRDFALAIEEAAE